jgi:hypothetical protein
MTNLVKVQRENMKRKIDFKHAVNHIKTSTHYIPTWMTTRMKIIHLNHGRTEEKAQKREKSKTCRKIANKAQHSTLVHRNAHDVACIFFKPPKLVCFLQTTEGPLFFMRSVVCKRILLCR